MGTRAKLYFSVLNQCNLKCNCCFLIQKWKMSYWGCVQREQTACVVSHDAPCLSPPLLPPPELSIWRHFTIFMDPAAFCLAHWEGPGSVYNSYFFESYFSTFICVCLETSLQISCCDPRTMATTLAQESHWTLKGMGWGGVVGGTEVSEATFIFQHDGF